MGICNFLVRLILLSFFLEQCTSLECSDKGTASVVRVNITCDDYLDFYVDGNLLGSGIADASGKGFLSYNITPGSHVIALKCRGRSSAWEGGIVGSFDNGLLSDTSWKCTNIFARGWNMKTYQDDDWPMAISLGPNAASTLPWGQISSINSEALWIWTQDNKNDTEIYCRRNLVDPCTKVESSFFETSDLYRDSSIEGFLLLEAKVASETECGLRCGQLKSCASFNVQYAKDHGLRICELNSVSVKSNPSSIVEREGFQYYERVQIYY